VITSRVVARNPTLVIRGSTVVLIGLATEPGANETNTDEGARRIDFPFPRPNSGRPDVEIACPAGTALDGRKESGQTCERTKKKRKKGLTTNGHRTGWERKTRRRTEKNPHRTRPFYLGRHEIAGTLLNGDLVGKRVRHAPPVPVQSPFVVVVPVEEVHLAVRLLHGLVQVQHLQQRPRAAFPHANDDRLRREKHARARVRNTRLFFSIPSETKERRCFNIIFNTFRFMIYLFCGVKNTITSRKRPPCSTFSRRTNRSDDHDVRYGIRRRIVSSWLSVWSLHIEKHPQTTITIRVSFQYVSRTQRFVVALKSKIITWLFLKSFS